MNLPWRIALYVVLALGAVFFTQRFFAVVQHDIERLSAKYAIAEGDSAETTPGAPATNAAELAAGSEAPADLGTNGVEAGPPSARAPRVAAPAPTSTPAPRKGLYGALALISVLGLGLMVGREVSQFIGRHVQRELYGEASDPIGDPEYDEAERVWADGDHIEAVRLLREFLKHKPNKLHAAFRIAEIYEKDLGNNLAAALEYEEILRHRFDRQRWGWAAIHLVNLYNRLGQSDKSDTWLRRVVEECAGTEAAAKARQHLGLPEEGAVQEMVATEEPPPGDGGFRLPPGFRPK